MKRRLSVIVGRPDSQTYMALTDPGDGHIMGTTR